MYFKINFILALTNFVLSYDFIDNFVPKKTSAFKPDMNQIPNRASRLGEPVLLECGAAEHQLLKKLESTDPSMPILVNWFKHYSTKRRSDKPIYAKYLANNIDYAPHISKDFENRIQVVDKINLNITSLRAVDEALYECRLILFDKAYADSLTGSMFYLQVQIAPVFEYPNEDIVYFKTNVPIRLYCYAKGKPIPSITWYKNGKYLEKNTSVLQETLSDNEVSDILEYKCRAENDVGFIEHTTKVIRSGSLFFTEPLRNLTIAEGTILNWPCLAQSNTEITYKWFKDSISVESHLFKWSDRGALFQDGMLYLLETYRTDSGFYECHAFTSNKRIITSAFLNVLYGPEIEPFPSPFYAFENSKSIVIDCVIRANPSISTLEWFKDQHLLSNTKKYQILTNNSLLIKNPNKNDEGNYYCVCNNTIKKTFSQHVKFELIEAKKFEKISFSTSNNQFWLPCMTGINNIQPDDQSVQWFKINSKLPLNRHSIDSNGSLILDNLRSTDSGFYYCKTKDDFAKRLLYDKQEFLIKLLVKKNRTSSDAYFSSENDLELSELPLCPQNVKLNQTMDGILVTWTYPQQTPVDIEYFQIYFREINDFRSKQINMIKNKINYEWKTTEPINSDTYNFIIDDTELENGKIYEIQLVSFSSFSKSLPTQNFEIKYQQKNDPAKELYSSLYPIEPTTSSYIKKFTLNSLNNLSQLDLILAAIFLILLCVLIISITACVLFRQTEKNSKKQQKGDIDDWGFQSSAVTTTFLSSSSEKSNSMDSFSQKNKLLRQPEIQYTLNKKIERKLSNKNVNKLKNETVLKDQEEDMLDDGDYYYAKPKIQTNTLKSRNFSYQSNSTSTGISSNPIDSSRSASSTGSTGSNQKADMFHSPNLINISDATSSGITSASVTSSLINSDDNNDDLSEKSTEFSVNKIKYNAKTNILSTQDNFKTGKMHRSDGRRQEYSIEENYSKILKNNLNKKQVKQTNDCVHEYSGISLDIDTANSSCGKKIWNESISPAKSNYSVEINDSINPVPPFPTCHFKEKLPLDSGSSLTVVSRLPTSSFSYISNHEAKRILSSESSSSSSSGCSSMAHQVSASHEVGKFCTLINDKNFVKPKKKNVNFVNQRNSLCINMDLDQKYVRPIEKKELIYSTNFKPALKIKNSNGNNLLLEESPTKYHTSTFKPNKIDYV